MSDSEQKRVLPPDRTKVKGMTYPSDEYDRDPEAITGELSTLPSPFSGQQCYISGIQVDPSTIEPVKDA